VTTNKIVLGTMMFGWKVSLIDAFKLVDIALKNNIDILDTSPSYGDFISEIMCGKLISHFPELKISTKFSIPKNVSRKKVSCTLTNLCEQSLNRLKKTTIDIYVLHSDENIPPSDIFCEAILNLKNKKLINEFFLSNSSLNTYLKIKSFEDLNKVKIIDGFQLKKNFLFSDPLLNFIDIRSDRRIFTYSPLCEGLLTAKYLINPESKIDSRFFQATKNLEYYNNLLSEENAKKVISLEAEAKEHCQSLIEYSYSSLFLSPFINKVIIGPSQISHLEEAIRCSEISVSKQHFPHAPVMNYLSHS